jgi:hypothetical protein
MGMVVIPKKYYPCHEYGLYIPEHDFEHLLKQYKKENDLEDVDDIKIIDEYLEAKNIEDTYNNMYNACTRLIDQTEEVNGYFLPSQKSGSIFKSDTHLLYNTPQDMADEFKAEFGELLPKDFNYAKNLALYEYVYYG